MILSIPRREILISAAIAVRFTDIDTNGPISLSVTTEVAFNTGALVLTPGATYVALMSPSEYGPERNDFAMVERTRFNAVGSNDGQGERVVGTGVGTLDPIAFTYVANTSLDLAFEAEFGGTP